MSLFTIGKVDIDFFQHLVEYLLIKYYWVAELYFYGIITLVH